MTSNRFFIDQRKILEPRVVLRGEEHHHLKNVSRIKSGETIWLIDESGNSYAARVELIEKNQTQLSILKKQKKSEARVKVTVAQALIKSRHFELVLQKSTELGICEFLPVISARSVVKIGSKLENKIERWTKITREAAKQSGVGNIPIVLQPKTLQEVVRFREDGLKLFLNERGGTPMRNFLVADTARTGQESHPSSVLVLIGPEGGWTETEEEDIVSHGFEAISLGSQVLRAETAAISSVAMINHFWNQDYVS